MLDDKCVFLWRGTALDLSFIDVAPGDWIVVKPNLIKENKENDQHEWRSVITSADLIRQVTEHLGDRLRGKGRITICDAPQTDSSFARIAERLGLYGIAESCRKRFNIRIDIVDLRNEEWTNEGGVITKRRKLAGDPEGTIKFNLGTDSLFYKHRGEGRYYGADYDAGVVNSHHRGALQEYLICATPIKADVFVNLPKMKTHKKTGVTLSLKNLVGINADKNWLPHHTEGSPADGGDEFPDLSLKRRFEQASVKIARKVALDVPAVGPLIAKMLRRAGANLFGSGHQVIRSGNWHGNDTTWRMVLDLNRCLLLGNPDGSLRTSNSKRYYSVVDGRIGMQGMGPMQCDAVQSGVVLGGTDPVAVDMVAARVMGFDWRKIATIREAFTLRTLPITRLTPNDVILSSDVAEWSGRYTEIEDREFLTFKPHFGWKGHIEYGGHAGSKVDG